MVKGLAVLFIGGKSGEWIDVAWAAMGQWRGLMDHCMGELGCVEKNAIRLELDHAVGDGLVDGRLV